MSKFLLPILAGIAMVIVSGCGGAASGSDDAKIAAQMEARRVAKLLADEITACGGTCAGYAEWLTANPDLPTVPIVEGDRATTNNTGHYLQGTATGLNTGDALGAVVTTVTFNDAFDDVDDNPFDGFAYFDGAENRRYVGILSNTNMGAPLATPVGRAIWPAFIASGEGIISGEDDFTTPTAFNLMVKFNTTGGTISAFIPASNPRFAFRIDGEFDAGGVITGTTSRRAYGNNTDITTYDPAPPANTEGTLRGLIGMQGAVGVFTTDATNAFVPYAGGFVAKPDPLSPLLPGADHTLYVSAFSPAPAVANLQTDSDVTLEFAQPTATGFSATGLRFETENNTACNSCFPNFIARLGGDNADTTDRNGFALIFGRFEGGSTARLRAGLLPDTDVGAPLGNVAPDGAATANWPGTIYHLFQRSGTEPNVVLTPFSVVFNVDFAAGTLALANTTLSGENTSAHIIRVEGRFGSHAEAVDRAATPAALPAGVLGGKVYYKNGAEAEVEHDLQGLIGAEGAVGVFRVLEPQFTFGGFVARNAPVPVNHEVYLARFSSLQPEKSGPSEFVRGLANGLDTTNVNFETSGTCATACVDNYTARLGGNNADPSGFSFFYGNGDATDTSASGIYRIGLLSGTDVGVALPVLAPNGMASAKWNGKLHTTLGASGGTITPQNLTLTVNYTNRMISGTNAISGGDLSVNGGYSPTGMIVGEVTYDPSSGSDSTYDLIGVIGTQGAIGIFEGRSNTPHVGGFIATPPPPPPPPAPCVALGNCPAVEFAAWEASFGTNAGNEAETLQESGFENESSGNDTYIKVTITGQIVSGTDGEQSLPLNVLRLNDTVNQEGYESGVSYAFNMPEFNDQGYAGLLPTTNLGAPLTDNTKNTIWTGKLGGRYSIGEGAINVGDFSLQVTYGVSDSSIGSVGTITTVGSNSMKGSTIVSATTINVDGYFNAAGVMWGDFAVGDEANNNASFSGLIGEKGAVGVFKGSSKTTERIGYVGGFIVKPPAP